MSSADKAKLDDIESGATGDQTASEILTAIKTVDGSGSGLDADLLDGVEHRGAGGTSEHPAATTSQAGFMSTSDKSKLDGIESGATADMTASEILASLKTVDGAGSGLDADLLDGVAHRGAGGTSEHPAATTSQAGFMSTSDKSKLDGIESGATADMTASEILASLKTVDGAGSGLDADLLDGVSHRGQGGYEHAVATTGADGFLSAGDKAKLDGLAAAKEYSFRTGTVSHGGVIPGPYAGYIEVATFTSMYYIQTTGDVDDNDKLGCYWWPNRVVYVGDWDLNTDLYGPPTTGGVAYYLVIGMR
jgi:hypothetical protein